MSRGRMNSRFTGANGKFSTRVSFSRITNALFRRMSLCRQIDADSFFFSPKFSTEYLRIKTRTGNYSIALPENASLENSNWNLFRIHESKRYVSNFPLFP